MNSTLTAIERDPVCEAIEKLLRDLAVQGKGQLQITQLGPSAWRVSFAEIQVDGPTPDVALVRLASAMMESPQYMKVLMQALQEPMAVAP